MKIDFNKHLTPSNTEQFLNAQNIYRHNKKIIDTALEDYVLSEPWSDFCAGDEFYLGLSSNINQCGNVKGLHFVIKKITRISLELALRFVSCFPNPEPKAAQIPNVYKLIY